MVSLLGFSSAATALLTFLTAAMPAKPPDARREKILQFAVDPSLQERGSIQYYFAVGHPEDSALEKEPFRQLVKLLPATQTGWGGLHAMASRFVYTLEKDTAFFTSDRAHDVAYIQALMPDARVERKGEATFRSNLIPGSTFKVRFVGPAELGAVAQRSEGLRTFLAFAPELGMPAAVAVQENYDFDRLMAVRTAAISVTWTGYYRVKEGRTRVVTYALTMLHNVPPFFLGGDGRLHDSLMTETMKLVEAMRRYRAPVPAEIVVPDAGTNLRDGGGEGASRPGEPPVLPADAPDADGGVTQRSENRDGGTGPRFDLKPDAGSATPPHR